jgi:hypothetical protein
MRRIALLALLLMTAVAPPARAIEQGALLDSLQFRGFLYFWEQANPANGLIKDRSTSTSPASIAAVGFGLSSICVGVDHGWVSRSDAAQRVLTTLNTFWTGPEDSLATGQIGYRGFFYHFLDMGTATRTWSSELSTIDTALLFAGILDAKMYFTDPIDPTEIQIRALADSIYRRADWNWFCHGAPALYMGWKPETATNGGFGGFGFWTGYNEAMILYILGLGSPTHAMPTNTWAGWTSSYGSHYATYYGYTFLTSPPLFTHQYSHCWIDFRGKVDSYMLGKGFTYFENSRRATLAQQAYAIANPLARVGYSDSLWGLTASDVPPPTGYNARGAPPSLNDDGTITPTAPGGSIAFAPEVCIPVLRNLYDNWHVIWGRYGFLDAFNLTNVWLDTDFLGIDQGPFVLMIENYRNNGIWNRFMRNTDIQTGLTRAGFVPFSDAVGETPPPGAGIVLAPASPNPSRGAATLRFLLPEPGRVTLVVMDVSGRQVARLVDGEIEAGEHAVRCDLSTLPAGVYHAVLRTGGAVQTTRFVHLR